jgi:hypothetical protein
MGEIENEEHFFLNCSSYKPARDNYIQKLKEFTFLIKRASVYIIEY